MFRTGYFPTAARRAIIITAAQLLATTVPVSYSAKIPIVAKDYPVQYSTRASTSTGAGALLLRGWREGVPSNWYGM